MDYLGEGNGRSGYAEEGEDNTGNNFLVVRRPLSGIATYLLLSVNPPLRIVDCIKV